MQAMKKMHMMRLAIAVCVVAYFFAGCGASVFTLGLPIWTIRTGNTDGSEKERFFSFPTPRTSHPPGYVYRTSRESAGDVWVTTLADPGLIAETSEFLPETSFEVSSDYLIGLVGLGEFDGTKQNKIRVKLRFEDCIREAASEADLSKAISKSNINFKMEEKYYIIQTVIKAKKVTIDFERYESLNVAMRARLDSLSVAGTLSKSTVMGRTNRATTETVTISREFEVPHGVCYKPLRINALGLLSSGNQEVILTVANEGIIIN
jgi:hypothetical protein